MRNRSAIVSPGLVAAAQLFRVVGHPDRVLGESAALEIAVELGRCREIVDLQLDTVVVGVAVVHRCRNTMVDRPMRQDAGRLQPAIGRQELAEAAVGVGDMVGSDRVRVAHREAGDVDQRQPVMLVVIRQKAEQFVGEYDPRCQYRSSSVSAYKFNHFVVTTPPQYARRV
jgi:hypothetical protein